MPGAELTSAGGWDLLQHPGWRRAGEMSQLCRGAQSAITFVPVIYIMPRSSAHVAVCPIQGLREAVVWAVLA